MAYRVAQKKIFCDRLESMGEVIIEWFYFYYFTIRASVEVKSFYNTLTHQFQSTTEFFFGATLMANLYYILYLWIRKG